MLWTRSERIVSILVAGLVVCALGAPAVAAATDPVASESGSVASAADPVAPEVDQTGFEIQQQEFDRTEFRIVVDGDGSATWLFRHERTLDTDEEREDFETFAEEFNTEETELFVDFRNRAETLTEEGSNATGREMDAEAFDREARVAGLDDNLGVVEMSFRWNGFGAVDGDRVVVGDIFAGGLYVGPDQRLVVERSDGLVFESVDPDPDSVSGPTIPESNSVTWIGERSFTDNRPRIVLADESAVTPAPTPTTTPPPPADSAIGRMLPAVVFVFVVLLGVGAAVAYRSGVFSPTDSEDGTGTAGSAAAEPDADVEPASSPPAVTDEDLMSDEDRVRALLGDNGGRMKQVNIVEETGWSKSKVSMLLSEMEDDGEITKLRIGRENIVSLSGHEPDAAGSPFDDE